MNPEDRSWQSLSEHAAAQLAPGFADRVLRAASAAQRAAPSLLGQCMLGAFTAALCFSAIVLFSGLHRADHQSASDWQQISTSADESGAGS